MTCDYNHTHQPGPECHRGRREIVLCVLIIRAGNLTFKNETMMTINNIPPYYYSYIIYPKDYHQKSFFLVCYTTGKSLSAIFTAERIVVQLFFFFKKKVVRSCFSAVGASVSLSTPPPRLTTTGRSRVGWTSHAPTDLFCTCRVITF